jgi:hypothetical protein
MQEKDNGGRRMKKKQKTTPKLYRFKRSCIKDFRKRGFTWQENLLRPFELKNGMAGDKHYIICDEWIEPVNSRIELIKYFIQKFLKRIF